MAAKKKAAPKKAAAAKGGKKKAAPGELIISKSRTKAAVTCKVSSEFYAAFDEFARDALAKAQARAEQNKRSTLRPQDL